MLTDPLLLQRLIGIGVSNNLKHALAQINCERFMQDKKWGADQDHLDSPVSLVSSVLSNKSEAATAIMTIPSASKAQATCDRKSKDGTLTWSDIAMEEMSEVVEAAAEGDLDHLQIEIIQLAAVCVGWWEAIERRKQAESKKNAGT